VQRQHPVTSEHPAGTAADATLTYKNSLNARAQFLCKINYTTFCAALLLLLHHFLGSLLYGV